MAGFYAYAATDDLGSGGDQVSLHKSAATLGDLVAEASYDPDASTPWARAQIDSTDHEGQILNEKTDDSVPVTACLVRGG
jgi:hypothetical protein